MSEAPEECAVKLSMEDLLLLDGILRIVLSTSHFTSDYGEKVKVRSVQSKVTDALINILNRRKE